MVEGVSVGRFAGRVVAVTGAARGIGRTIASAFGAEGATVAVCDLDEATAEATVLDLRDRGHAVEFLPVDLARAGAPQRMIREVAQRFGGLDILVNNARAGARRALLDEDEKSWEEGVSVTLRAAFFASQEAVRHMREGCGGNIVNIASLAALLTCKESPVYHIAKAGMIQMTRYFSAAVGDAGVRVNCILPGFIVQDEDRSRFESAENHRYRHLAEFCHPVGSVGTSLDVAKAVLFLCSPDASFITGQSLVVDGGLAIQDPSDLLFRFDGGGS